ncbi:efflux RND transporter periplasmic adaptor subunit [Labilibacter marinus]|uniref:efflux RND transporter periplasmic adaptor subunit n=1 Tax=Labilibacter marinus TaxID=1477105 RepID=UPI000950305A|nr:hypothetical protein [Labilibacter marinus]
MLQLKYIFLLIVLLKTISLGAQHNHQHSEEIPTIKFSQIINKVEIFAEYTSLVLGQNSRFICHFTSIDQYKPISNATVELYFNDILIEQSDKVLRNGIFVLNFTPQTTSSGNLMVVLKYNQLSYAFSFKDSRIFTSTHESIHEVNTVIEPDIVFLKEQAWGGEFGVIQIKKKPFEDVIHTSGELLSSVDNKIAIVAQSDGILKLRNEVLLGKRYLKGQSLGIINGKNMENSRELSYKTAYAIFIDAEANFIMASQLVQKQTISRKEYHRIKAIYEQAKAKMEVYGYFNNDGKYVANDQPGITNILSPREGYISEIKAINGTYIQKGEVIAQINVGESYLLKVDFPKHEFNKLAQVTDANFIPEYLEEEEVLSVLELGGVPLKSNQKAATSSPYIPYYFNLPSHHKIIPNSYASVSIKCKNIGNKKEMVIPISSLIEKEGSYWVFVELEGENYTKREVTIGDDNGQDVIVLSGLTEGEVVVTRGAYRVKQAALSSDIPEHTH